MKLYCIETEEKMIIIEAKNIKDAVKQMLKISNLEKEQCVGIHKATTEDINWYRALGGYVNEELALAVI